MTSAASIVDTAWPTDRSSCAPAVPVTNLIEGDRTCPATRSPANVTPHRGGDGLFRDL
jgi:hypothetical protein